MVAVHTACDTDRNVGFLRISRLVWRIPALGLKPARRESLDTGGAHADDRYVESISRRTLLQRLALDRTPKALARVSHGAVVMRPLARLAYRPGARGCHNSRSTGSHSRFLTT